ncbi:EAL domain-containing protein [Trinickia caryophylli]|uniref:PAS domain S-box-containing protein/diguanylate cyclase (GGDEF) domain-containing protein n=2 Tax=Trinickia caryophylli TaxID=28094 RepID=A0A1X7D0F9_TRICW|nr:EAL domain-containing protein [Trinickia caryophylli]SMF06401.1 PAS domain S-box-containing protein/diguanylate cyclase (GGDEF) domain-containing protein [Trinickia caryophylli]
MSNGVIKTTDARLPLVSRMAALLAMLGGMALACGAAAASPAPITLRETSIAGVPLALWLGIAAVATWLLFAALAGWFAARTMARRGLKRLAAAAARLQAPGTIAHAVPDDAPQPRFADIERQLDASACELAQREHRWRSSLHREAGHIEVLRRIAQNDPLDDALVLLTRFAEQQVSGSIASVMMLDPNTYTFDACIAPSLPASYRNALVGIRAGSGVGSCGTSVAERRVVVTEDIFEDPLWQDYRELAKAYGLRACWSHPIISAGNRVLGSFALYYREARAPREDDLQIGQLGAEIAALSIERTRTAQALVQSEAEYRSLFERNPNPMWVCDARTRRFLAVNDPAIARYGFTREQFLSMSEADLEWRDRGEAVAEALDGKTRRHTSAAGKELVVEIVYFPLRFSGNDASLALITDLTYRRTLARTIREQNELFSSLMESTVEAIYGLDSEGRCTFVNGACERLLGYSSDELVGKRMHDLVHHSRYDGRVHHAAECRIHALQCPGAHTHADDQVFWRKNGTALPVECWAYPMMKGGAVCGTIVTFLDTTERRRQEDALRCQASLDMLTGLLNRTSFVHVLDQRVHDALAAGEPLFVGIVDLDGFKEINDSLGHEAGDQLLREVGRRLMAELPEYAAVGRLGGDEFAFLIGAEYAQRIELILERLVEALREPFAISGMDLQISGSIGVARCPEAGTDVRSLLRHADTAMYRAKRESIGYVICSELASGNARRLVLSRLRHALAKREFVLYFQPKVSLRGAGRMEFEALIRWQDPERGLVGPTEFMPILELSDLIHPLTQWVVESAVERCLAFGGESGDAVVAVNISTRNLLDVSFPQKVSDILTRHRFAPHRLKLEITESAVMADPSRSLKALTDLHRLGVKIAIDDFGTGYSSLSYLQRLPVDELKIDRSFVTGMLENEAARTIVCSIIGLAHSLRIEVTAEGMETGAVLDELRSIGCDYAQGYFVARPMSLVQLHAWVAATNWFEPAAARHDSPLIQLAHPARLPAAGCAAPGQLPGTVSNKRAFE